MARPEKCKQICNIPKNSRFYCENLENSNNFTVLTLEEYETIRLIDYIGLTQAECAEQMHVARTTVQRLYTDARRKLAEFIINGTTLDICGGNYKICENNEICCQEFSCVNRKCGCTCDLRISTLCDKSMPDVFVTEK
ncbi:MAG: DUF134 domain-containing protein [Anaerovoracaceae bacterium]